MKTITVNLYKFAELSEEAQQTAIDHFRSLENNVGYAWSDETLDSLKKLIAHFGITLKDYSIDWFNVNGSNVKIEFENEQIEELSGVRLWKYLHNNDLLRYFNKYTKKTENLLDGNCPFTGFCMDEPFLDVIREFVKKPINITFRELMEEGIERLLRAAEKDAEYQFSDKGIKEGIDANSYDFTEDGQMA